MTYSSLVQAQNSKSKNEDYQEVTYDELLNELSTKKSKITQEKSSPFDEIMIHAGIGFLNSYSEFKVNGENLNRFQSGMQLALGIDLFSNNWYSEGVFKNYGITTQNSEDITLREIDLKIGYKDMINNVWSYSFGPGIANRMLKISDTRRNIDINESSPSFLLTGGIQAHPNKNIAIGLEANARSAFVNNTADRSSYDLALTITTSL